KQTAEKAAKLLGLNETQLIHIALAQFVAREVPHYEVGQDDLSEAHYEAIRKRVDQTRTGKVLSSLID
ncbi:MAG: hypothetical protein ACREVL_14205, partial [Solimonas sp.]